MINGVSSSYPRPYKTLKRMKASEFQIDANSWNDARQLTAELQREHSLRLADRDTIKNISFDYWDNDGGTSWQDERKGDQFTGALSKFQEDIPLDDVAADVRDFRNLASLADEFNLKMPVAIIDHKLPPLPLLPRKGWRPLAALDPSLSRKGVEDMFGEILEISSMGLNGSLLLRQEVQDAFFSGLSTFLAARIAGVRWVRKARGEEIPGARLLTAAAGGGGGSTSGEGRISGFQKWTVHTIGVGYSLYYSGTHACRTGAIYLNAPTTPVDVHLPMGTLYLAANAGFGGGYVWDKSVITVPNPTPAPGQPPIYYTKAF